MSGPNEEFFGRPWGLWLMAMRQWIIDAPKMPTGDDEEIEERIDGALALTGAAAMTKCRLEMLNVLAEIYMPNAELRRKLAVNGRRKLMPGWEEHINEEWRRLDEHRRWKP